MSRAIAHVKPSAQGLICPEEPFRFEVRFDAAPLDFLITVDLYDPSNPAHPEGHFSHWSFPIEGRRVFTIEVDAAARPPIRIDGHDSVEFWENPDLELAAASRVALHVVLQRTKETPVEQHEFPWVRSRAALDEAERLLDAPGYVRQLAPPKIGLDEGARVHVVATALRTGDAIGNLALDAARALRHHGFDVRLFARHMGPELWGLAEPVDQLPRHARAGDLVLHQYSVADPDLDTVLASPATKVCFYHGVTPAHFFWAEDSDLAAACRAGLAELPRLAGFDGLIAATSFTAAELSTAVGDARRVHLVPPTLNLARFDELEAAPPPQAGLGRCLLYVGRFAPHKGVGLLLDAFAAYAEADPECSLVLAGVPGAFDIAAHLATLAPELAARVHVIEQAEDAQLKSLYRDCTAYVSASEHEGFCLPLAEALGFAKPVFAYDTPAVRETLGGAGQLFRDRDPIALAALWRSVLLDPETLEDQHAGLRTRGVALRQAADGHRLWEALADAVSRKARPS